MVAPDGKMHMFNLDIKRAGMIARARKNYLATTEPQPDSSK